MKTSILRLLTIFAMITLGSPKLEAQGWRDRVQGAFANLWEDFKYSSQKAAQAVPAQAQAIEQAGDPRAPEPIASSEPEIPNPTPAEANSEQIAALGDHFDPAASETPMDTQSESQNPSFLESLRLIKNGMVGLCAGPYSYIFATASLVNSGYTLGYFSNANQNNIGFWRALRENSLKLVTVAASLCSTYTILNKTQSEINPKLASITTIIAALGLINNTKHYTKNHKSADNSNTWMAGLTALLVSPMIVKSASDLFS